MFTLRATTQYLSQLDMWSVNITMQEYLIKLKFWIYEEIYIYIGMFCLRNLEVHTFDAVDASILINVIVI